MEPERGLEPGSGYKATALPFELLSIDPLSNFGVQHNAAYLPSPLSLLPTPHSPLPTSIFQAQ